MSSRPRCTHRCGRAFPRSSRSSSPSERWCGCRTRSRTSAWRGPSVRSYSAAFSANASTESPSVGGASSRVPPNARWFSPTSRAPGDQRPGRSRSRSHRQIRSPASGRSCASRRASARAWRAGSGREMTATAACACSRRCGRSRHPPCAWPRRSACGSRPPRCPICARTCTNGSTPPRSPGSTSFARRFRSAPGWCRYAADS